MTTYDNKAKFELLDGRILLTGIEGLIRALLDRIRLDQRNGLHTRAFVSGYPGSPLGGVDLTLERNRALLEREGIIHNPGLNEELAAASIWGSQQSALVPYEGVDGVLGMWYGKSPGVDRSGDAFRHANWMGVGRNGGVLVVAGDDPTAKSSSVPNDSSAALYDAGMPVLFPGNVQEVIDLATHGYALSRYTGCWVGMRITTNVADGFGSAHVGGIDIRTPAFEHRGRPWEHQQLENVIAQWSLQQEQDLFYGRLEAAKAYTLENALNEVTVASASDRLGIIAAGKTYHEVVEALTSLGLPPDELSRIGVRLLRLGMTYPVEPSIVSAFAQDLDEVLVIEEKRPFIEWQVRSLLYGRTRAPRLIGKDTVDGIERIPADGELLAGRLRDQLGAAVKRVLGEDAYHSIEPRLSRRQTRALRVAASGALAVVSEPDAELASLPPRAPAFCSGCPHNTSTVVPDGSPVGGGVGCHGIIYMEERHANETILPLTPMGAEGAPWIGLAPFTGNGHLFQNLGDGTLTHSGVLAIRAAIAAGTNITFKVLYNAAVAMTGGQDVAGIRSVPELTRMFEAEGVGRIVICADDPKKYGRRPGWAPGVQVRGRDELERVQRELREVPGVTVLIYDQRCAAEARRLRKRGRLETPTKRVVINEAVCEGCGDCGTKSNCLSVHPVDTDYGRKTQIHQGSCNFDYSCLQGDCPSFITVTPKAPVKDRKRSAGWAKAPAAPEPEPRAAPRDGVWSCYLVGIGGTGVVTANQVLATAAFIEGMDVLGLDQTGLSQKAGPVASHLRLRAGGPYEGSNLIGDDAADCYFALDLVAASSPSNLHKPRRGEATAVLNTTVVPTVTNVTDPGAAAPTATLLTRAIDRVVARDQAVHADCLRIAESIFGDPLQANLVAIGAAYQAGLLPLSAEAIEAAIDSIGVAVDANTEAFRWGRVAVADPDAVADVTSAGPRVGSIPPRAGAAATKAAVSSVGRVVSSDHRLHEVVLQRTADLIDYQNQALAERYLQLVRSAFAAARRVGDEEDQIPEAVARNFFKLLAYKDEYEVARLHLLPQLWDDVERELGPGAKVRFHLHPPVLRALGMKRKIAVGRWFIPVFKCLRAARRLRGTRFDVFGYARVRRVERRLVDEYEADLTAMLASMAPKDIDDVVARACLPDEVRGYEEIKLASVERYRERAATYVERVGTGG